VTHANILGRIPWTRDQPVAVISTLKHITLNKRETTVFPVGFEHAIRKSERQQTYTFDRAAIGIVLEGIITSPDLET